MKHMKTVEIPAKEASIEEVLDYVSCDICNRRIEVYTDMDICVKCFLDMVATLGEMLEIKNSS